MVGSGVGLGIGVTVSVVDGLGVEVAGAADVCGIAVPVGSCVQPDTTETDDTCTVVVGGSVAIGGTRVAVGGTCVDGVDVGATGIWVGSAVSTAVTGVPSTAMDARGTAARRSITAPTIATATWARKGTPRPAWIGTHEYIPCPCLCFNSHMGNGGASKRMPGGDDGAKLYISIPQRFRHWIPTTLLNLMKVL